MNDTEEMYREKTIEAAINNIICKMETLRGANETEKLIMRRRWIWELIQNANDCANNHKVKIWIKCSSDKVEFSHNGHTFTYKDMIDLITQISSKRLEKEDMTGKFGTGFISTHLISPKVRVSGLYHHDKESKEYKKLNIWIDRSNISEQELKKSIVKSIQSLEDVDKDENIVQSIQNNIPSTTFTYDLSDKSDKDVDEAIKAGCIDLDTTIPFVLAFADKIEEVNCNGVCYYLSGKTSLCDGIEVYSVNKVYNNSNENVEKQVIVCKSADNEVMVGTFLEKKDGKYYVQKLVDSPKLFCRFPMIGTEKFPFPIVINSSKFELFQERNYIHENSQKNIQIINAAIQLYIKVIKYMSINKWGNLENMCRVSKFTNSELQRKLLKAVEGQYETTPLVETDGSSTLKCLCSYSGQERNKVVSIPFIEKQELQSDFWNLVKQIKVEIPTKDSYLSWGEICPANRVDIQGVCNLLRGRNLEQVTQYLHNEINVFSWLNNLYGLLIAKNGKEEFKCTGIMLNQNLKFCDIKQLYFDDAIQDDLKDILLSLGEDIREKLIHREIKLPEDVKLNSYNNEIVANKICSFVRKQLVSETDQSKQRSKEMQGIFNKITDWFFKHQEEAKGLFADIYEKQHILSKPEETIRRLELATSVENAMQKNNIDKDQLNIIIDKSGEILHLIEEGKVDISDEARKLFQHISNSSVYSKEKLDYLINRTIASVYKVLSNSPLYVVPDSLEAWENNKLSRTVFTAKRQGNNIRVVIRPSDGDKIIFYEDQEMEALDDTNYELWTENDSKEVRMVTLGDLIKTTGISVIPLRKVIK